MWNTTGLGRAVRATLVIAPHLPTWAEACISMGSGQGQYVSSIKPLPEPKTNKGKPRTWEILLSIFPKLPNPERLSA